MLYATDTSNESELAMRQTENKYESEVANYTKK